MGTLKRTFAAMLALALTAAGAAMAYQSVARQRDYRALLARGDAALREDQMFSAIEAYSGAIALRPDSMLAHLRLGETYQRRGDIEEAAREFRRAAGLDPAATRPIEELGDAEYERQRYGLAIEAYQRSVQLDDRSARVSYKLALAQYRDGRIDAALASLGQVVRLDGRMADAYYLQGICLREKRQMPAAVKALETAVSLSPGLIPAREELADLYRALGRRQDELEQLQLLAGLDREHVERQVAIALAHARAGHGDLAVVTLGNALERAPDQPLLYNALGRVWLDLTPTRTDALPKALEALERAASEPSATSEMLTLYGRALLQSGSLEAAERTLEQATTRQPLEPASFQYYAIAAEQQNHLDAARRALLAYGALVPNDPEIASRAARIGALSMRLNDAAVAAQWFERAAAASPNDVRLLTALADAQQRAGDRDAAEATIARGLERDPDNASLIALAKRLR
jgi:tetratricopeptide (TPR) repeat protein